MIRFGWSTPLLHRKVDRSTHECAGSSSALVLAHERSCAKQLPSFHKNSIHSPWFISRKSGHLFGSWNMSCIRYQNNILTAKYSRRNALETEKHGGQLCRDEAWNSAVRRYFYGWDQLRGHLQAKDGTVLWEKCGVLAASFAEHLSNMAIISWYNLLRGIQLLNSLFLLML